MCKMAHFIPLVAGAWNTNFIFMRTISILLLDHVNLAGLENARQGFLATNEYRLHKGLAPAFHVELLGKGEDVQLDGGLYAVRPQGSIHQRKSTDVIVIPPVKNEKLREAMEANRAYYPWIAEQFSRGAEILCLCLGAFILGGTGLLTKRKCTTHWRAQDQFKKLFPRAILMRDSILTEDKGIYTGGGAFSSTVLILYIIEKLVDRESAIYCSKLFQIDMSRKSQSPFVIFEGQKDHDDEAVLKAQSIIESEYEGELNVSGLAARLRIGRRTLERRFKNATGDTVLSYLQRARIEAAKRDLEKGGRAVKEIMYKVGYSDARSFGKLFKRYVGVSPIEYRQRYA